MAQLINIVLIAFGIVALSTLGYLAYTLIGGALNNHDVASKGRSNPNPNRTNPSQVPKRGLTPAKSSR
jgi:hypothetical protein